MAPPSSSSSSRRPVFGQTMQKRNPRSGPSSNYQRQFHGGSSQSKRHSAPAVVDEAAAAAMQNQEQRAARLATIRRVEAAFGLDRPGAATNNSSSASSFRRRGWLYNVLPTTVTVSDDPNVQGPERSGLDLYFMATENDAPPFVATLLFRPYFYAVPTMGGGTATMEHEWLSNAAAVTTSSTAAAETEVFLAVVSSRLRTAYEPMGLAAVETVYRQDLDRSNHLSPSLQRQGPAILKLSFDTTAQLSEVRHALQATISQNHPRHHGSNTTSNHTAATMTHTDDPLRCLTELREYDVPYAVRVCIDLDIRAGSWYTVHWDPPEWLAPSPILPSSSGHPEDSSLSSTTTLATATMDTGGVRLMDPDRESKAEPVVLAFDIECTKAPLKFPRADVDEIFMISYMVSSKDGTQPPQGYLIVSRSVVSANVHDFEYTPKPNYPGPFHIFNEVDEKALLNRFFAEFRRHCPQIVVTYNGDFFDFPFVDARAQHYGMDLFREIGVSSTNLPSNGGDNNNNNNNSSNFNNKNQNNVGGYRGRWTVHLDAFHWVQRDSYLPQGAQGLKAVTKYKLGYDPVEVDPEDMVRFAHEKPVHMATYSVSDAVATYYLYEQYVHLFIFSLSTLIPMGPEDVLGKGSGTLCEALLMVQACRKGILCPNKQTEALTQFHNGHLLEAETYIGGKVECLESGVFRSDLLYDFDLQPKGFQELMDNLDRDLTFAIEVEGGKSRSEISNYDEVRGEISKQLEMLRDRPKRTEQPSIYHLDVGAMYPNIILTNRLQPNAIVSDATCAACDFHQSKNGCKREMEWIWRGDYSPASRADYERTKDQLRRETQRDSLSFDQLPEKEQAALVAERLKTYSRKAYKKTKITEEETRKDVVCMRENDFYVDTVRQFRDRRYDYKKLNKDWKKKLASAKDAAARKQCEDRVLVYDSLQVAHKCILNSFYGYVMRKGARWRSMEMAGIVTKTGADIITQARLLVEQIGRPLELDTDGIWCILPSSFPEVFTFDAADGSKLKVEYPCLMLNANVHDKFTNHQFQSVVDPERGIYKARSECSIFFEVDGPYRCMVIPASTEEGKLLKKRYAVFNFDGSLAELKGFELKRRGELELIKTFQSQVFERFLDGTSLEECYGAVANIANHWIDVIDTRGDSLDDEELVDLISENRSMSRQLEDYGEQKGTSQTTARRLGEFLGADIIKDKGLNCKFIIAEQPYGSPVTDRAIPTVIWKSEPAIMKHYLRKWLKSPGLDGDGLDIRNILDWDYYRERLGKTIQKIITIPAALQKVTNPVPRIAHPNWLESKINLVNDRFQQRSIRSMFSVLQLNKKDSTIHPAVDMEDIGGAPSSKVPLVHKLRYKKVNSDVQDGSFEDEPESRVVLSGECFGDWLKQKKSAWRKLRKDNRLSTSSNDRARNTKKQRSAVSMEAFVRDAALSLSEKEWQILEVREMSSYDALSPATQSGSGDFIVWVMVGASSIQKLIVSVPRIVYVSTRKKIHCISTELLGFQKVDKHLPYSKSAPFVYEVTMPEQVYKSNKWIKYLQPTQPTEVFQDVFESLYESGTPLLSRIITELGSIARLNPTAIRSKKTRSYSLSDLIRIDRPSEGEYLHRDMQYKRVFLYVRINPKTKTGLVSVFIIKGRSSSSEEESERTIDVTRPSDVPSGECDVGASCSIWIIKPKTRNSQRSISLKLCENMFSQLITTVQDVAGHDSQYSCISPASTVQLTSLNYVDNEQVAFSGANETISNMSKTGQGATLLLLNSSTSTSNLRRSMSVFSALPVLPISFPPGPAHDPSLSNLPSLNWEQPAVQLSLEAYLFLVVVSYPKRVSYCRYGQVPIGNLGEDENGKLFDVSLSRLIYKNRALSWASPTPGRPDIGLNFIPSTDGGSFPSIDANSILFNPDEIWGDDDELVSPVVRRSGCYRSICVDIDLQDLAIAALTNVASITSSSGGMMQLDNPDPSSPNNVAFFDGSFNFSKVAGPLGDEMSTSISLPIIQALVSGWLRDAFVSNSIVADELLHHIYRLISNQDTLLYDPALHRVIHSIMKTTFLRLLGELQRLGCTIVFASFHKITVATNKVELSDAEEYIKFVIETALRQSKTSDQCDDALTKVSLRPRQFHSNFVFLDEFNFGTMQLDRIDSNEMDGSVDFSFPDSEDVNCTIVPTVITAWSLMNFLGSERAQMYFRVIMGRFSREVLKKQMDLISQNDVLPIVGALGMAEPLLEFKRKMISQHFASSLTRAVGEILKDGPDDVVTPALSLRNQAEDAIRLATNNNMQSALDFVKNVIAVLELDSDIEAEVHGLKRSLLSQLGVAEYASIAQWVNPCPAFVLPDVFCSECHDTRDVNLCYVPPRSSSSDNDEETGAQAENLGWSCDECGTPYNVLAMEGRLMHVVQKKLVRYVMQDVRCTKTNRIATRALSALSDSSQSLKLDVSRTETLRELRLLRRLAELHGLEILNETIVGILTSYQSSTTHTGSN